MHQQQASSPSEGTPHLEVCAHGHSNVTVNFAVAQRLFPDLI
jgi:hypothetical protein